ncbi:MAG: DUF4160 domain-containing protein [Treponema sp.]|nr:DUF4160 domain-containing protein [Treponema sp.]
MPDISRFYGLVVKMFFSKAEHNPPHIHVSYGECAGVISLDSGEMLEGDLPPRAFSILKEWFGLHKNELLEIWNSQQFKKLPPLE